MDTLTMPMSGLPSDQAINGYFPQTVMPSSVQMPADAPAAHGSPMALPGIANVSSILIWWFILFGLCVAFHVITLRAPAG